MEVIDFSSCRNFNNEVFPLQVASGKFSGENLKFRMHILYNGDFYLVKTRQNNVHECFGEYIGSHIFNILGIPAHETLLGVIDCFGQKVPAVACKLINSGHSYICDFSNVANRSKIDLNPYSLEYYLEIAKKQTWVTPDEMVKQIWRVLAVDAYIGNYDGFLVSNWGALWNEDNGFSMLPVTDNGNCLCTYALELDPSLFTSMVEAVRRGKSIVTEANEIAAQAYDGIYWQGKNLSFLNFYQSVNDKCCYDSLCEITEKIEDNEEKINQMIDDAPLIHDLEKKLYKVMLYQRKREILQRGLKSLRGKMI